MLIRTTLVCVTLALLYAGAHALTPRNYESINGERVTGIDVLRDRLDPFSPGGDGQ